MGAFKSVKAVEFEEKSTQEIEQELLDKHAKENGALEEEAIEKVVIEDNKEEEVEDKKEEVVVEETKPIEIDDNIVLSHLRKKFGNEDLSYEALLQKEVIEKELPEDVEAFRKYREETGRGINDFAKLNRDITAESPKAIIAEYIASTNPSFDSDDIAFEMERYEIDEDLDDERDVKSKKLALKKDLSAATEYFNKQKEMYKTPLESNDGFISKAEREDFEQYKANTKIDPDKQEEVVKKKEHFSSKTNELFSKFEGFEYKIGDNKVSYKSSDAETIKNSQLDAMNFMQKHLDQNGMLKDAAEYHKALNAAMDPDALFKFAYEQGAADAIAKEAKEAKAIDMSARPSGAPSIKSGTQVRDLSIGNGSRLVIKSKK